MGKDVEMDYCCEYSSPLGKLLLACDDLGLIGLWFEEAKYYASVLSDDRREMPEHPILGQTKIWLDAYFANEALPDLPPLNLRGSDFRRLVWQEMLAIPYGQTVTYGYLGQKVAKQMGVPSMSGQAIGGAVGHNPISLIIPCHRVLGANGELTGYAGGLDRKLALLTLEGVSIETKKDAGTKS